jgi:hypothetical protein
MARAGAGASECAMAARLMRRPPRRRLLCVGRVVGGRRHPEAGGTAHHPTQGRLPRRRRGRCAQSQGPSLPWPGSPPPEVSGRRDAPESSRIHVTNTCRTRQGWAPHSAAPGVPKAKNRRPIRYSGHVIRMGTAAKNCSRARTPMTLCSAARIRIGSLGPRSYLLTILAARALLGAEVRKPECRAQQGS